MRQSLVLYSKIRLQSDIAICTLVVIVDSKHTIYSTSFVLYWLISITIAKISIIRDFPKVVFPPWGCPLGCPPLWYLHCQQTLYYTSINYYWCHNKHRYMQLVYMDA